MNEDDTQEVLEGYRYEDFINECELESRYLDSDYVVLNMYFN